ncbi:hypothetical protein L9F63_016242, partial [Diploptera punctata]
TVLFSFFLIWELTVLLYYRLLIFKTYNRNFSYLTRPLWLELYLRINLDLLLLYSYIFKLVLIQLEADLLGHNFFKERLEICTFIMMMRLRQMPVLASMISEICYCDQAYLLDFATFYTDLVKPYKLAYG